MIVPSEDLLNGLELIWPHGDELTLADNRMTQIYKSMSRYYKGPSLTLRQFEELCTSLIEVYLEGRQP